MEIKVPKKLLPVFKRHDIKILYGGRSSAKTATVIRYLIVRAMQDSILILCAREYQASIETSTYAELRAFIIENNLLNFFTIKHDKIVGKNGSEFIFKGLARDIWGVKGIPNIGICYVDEAETISELSWDILIPTVEKKDGSELIITFNPRDSQSITYQRFVKDFHNLAGNNLLLEINYPDNPYLSKKQLATILKLRDTDYAKYEHTYLGKVLDISEAVIFKSCFEIKELELSPLTQRRYGQDYGFSQDPFAHVEIYVIDDDTIYINNEIYETGLLPTRIPARVRAITPLALKQNIYGDAARPDTIAELNNLGLRVKPAAKGKGSVESGIQYLQGKKILIHPKCVNTIYEFYNYKFKQDKEGTILSEPIDANNHIIDAIRYAMSEEITAIRRNKTVNPNVLRMF